MADTAPPKKKLTPQERARQAGVKRRDAARKVARKGSKGAWNLYYALVSAILGVWSAFFLRAIRAPDPTPLTNVTAPRVQLTDGRHIAYLERGASAEAAKYHVVYLHGWQSCRLGLPPSLSQAFLSELGVRLVSYDRPGYGQSDPNPARSVLSDARDLEELASLLNLGDRFYLLGESMGGYVAWGALKHIPDRLAGVGLLAPVGSFNWPAQSDYEAERAWVWLVNSDRMTHLVARHAPFFLHFWMAQPWVPKGNWGPPAGQGGGKRAWRLGGSDNETLALPSVQAHFAEVSSEALRQGPSPSYYADLRVISSSRSWGFDLADLADLWEHPEAGSPSSAATVHIWQGTDDWIVPPALQDYAARVLPWLELHEVEGAGHFFAMGTEAEGGGAGWWRKILMTTLGLRQSPADLALLDAQNRVMA